MAKKIGLVLVLASMLAGGVWAQEKSASVKKMWASGEVSLVGAGARFEYMLTPKLSLGVNAYWTSLFFVFNDIGANAVARFYPWGKSFYAGVGLGLGIHTGTLDFSYEYAGGTASGTWFGSITGVDIVPELGWKIDVGNPGGFFINPVVQLPVTIGGKSFGTYLDDVLSDADKFGVGIGFRAAFGLGWAF